MPAPANDNFANAIPLAGLSGIVTVTVDDATTEVGEPRGDNVIHLAQTAWYTFTAPREGLLVLDTLGSTTPPGSGDAGPDGFFDTTLAVWAGSSLAGLTEIASNDDVNPVVTLTSGVVAGVLAGETVYIQVGAHDTGYLGTVHLNYRFANYDAHVSAVVINDISVGSQHVDNTISWSTSHPMAGLVGCTSDKKLIGISSGGVYTNWTGVTSIFGPVLPPSSWGPWGDIGNSAFKRFGISEQFWGQDDPAVWISDGGHINWLLRDVAAGETFTWERPQSGITGGHWDVEPWYGVLLALDISPTPTEFPTPVPQGVESPDPNTTVAAASSGTGTSVSTNYPSGRSQPFEWIFAIVAWDDAGATFTATGSTWTMIANRTDAGSGTGVALYARYVVRADFAPAFDGVFSSSVDWSVSMLAVLAPEAPPARAGAVFHTRHKAHR